MDVYGRTKFHPKAKRPQKLRKPNGVVTVDPSASTIVAGGQWHQKVIESQRSMVAPMVPARSPKEVLRARPNF